MKESMSGGPSPWWQQTRAALARLFGHVQVRQMGLHAPCATASHPQEDATVWPAPAPVTHEHTWLLGAATHRCLPPAVPAGEGDWNGAVLLCTVSGSIVPHLPESGVQGGKAGWPAPQVWAADIGQGAGGAGTVLTVSVRLSGGQAFPLPVALPSPSVRAVSAALSGGARVGAARDRRSGVPLFGVPRAWTQLDRVTRVPLLRRRAAPSAEAGGGERFLAERQALASSCGATAEDVVVLAAFPHIPLTLVQQMAVTPDGETLRLWLRPEALASGAGWTAARVTIVLGWRRSTEETIRAVLPQSQTAERKR